ncbi:flagellar motor switch protein FliN/FliY [Sporomusaceae bacterium BoRhaA]|uniref:flagellar motor switch phosphatase FliY n=1 Tax=Pelorhabdus rhamnosifermentans TaxID=2772457 RepID=UPI001C0617C5|nr:flagellar motor switch phosphatase FliY [Pelorhabdus rhamnosifermentans]MBU2702002.1 flagellar motor switch protein FliN/FliY [Pelorhabdus rhamnosifermentans]
MSDGFLSQEEIDALLKGESSSSPAASEDKVELSTMEEDALGEIGNISMGSAATTLSILLGKTVSITTPRVSISTLNEIKEQYPLPYVVIEVSYTHGLVGTNILAMREQDALIIADLMMGGDGSNPPTELSELYSSAVTEAMNQMMGATATSISTMFKKKIDISPPTSTRVDFATDSQITDMAAGSEPIVRVSFRMEVENLIDSEIMQLVSVDVAKEMVGNLMEAMQKAEAPAASPASVPSPAPVAAQSTGQAASYAAPNMTQLKPSQPAPNVVVQPAQFAPLTPGGVPISDTNINLIMDVPLQVTVELGRTRKLIREILDLSAGSVIELDKLAGEPVDILVNGKLIAKGEVVVIDENFGVRVTDILSPLERATNLQ